MPMASPHSPVARAAGCRRSSRAGDTEGARRAARALRDIYGDRLVIECWDHGLPEERELATQLIPIAALARRAVGRGE